MKVAVSRTALASKPGRYRPMRQDRAMQAPLFPGALVSRLPRPMQRTRTRTHTHACANIVEPQEQPPSRTKLLLLLRRFLHNIVWMSTDHAPHECTPISAIASKTSHGHFQNYNLSFRHKTSCCSPHSSLILHIPV
jgi:hypothetical protein